MRYLMFHLARDEFGLPIENVREVLRMQEITGVPKSASCMRGVMNLRGKIIAVMDLRVRLGYESQDSETSCIVVAQDGDVQFGMIVDGVLEVRRAGEEQAGTLLNIEEVLTPIVK